MSLTSNKKNIVMCADDFGMSPAIDDGVLYLAQLGRLSATSCLTLGPTFNGQALALKQSGLQTGVHINFTQSLGREGVYLSLPRLIRQAFLYRLDVPSVRLQIMQQLDSFEAVMGREPDFVDGHQHVHQFPQIRDELLFELARRYPKNTPWLRYTGCRSQPGIPWLQRFKALSVKMLGSSRLAQEAIKQGFAVNSRFFGVYDFQGGESAYRKLLAVWLRHIKNDDVLMCHPASRVDPNDGLGRQREAEFRVLASDELGQWLADNSINLVRRTTNSKENTMAVTVKPITENFAVAPQLSAHDMADIAKAGFKSVIINRPDFEGGADQPASSEVMAAARAAGLVVEYQPVVSGSITADDVSRFGELLERMPEPVLAYCRSGGRCTSLYNAAKEQKSGS